jgi:tetratricopeptide (TPR) repeat protein
MSERREHASAEEEWLEFHRALRQCIPAALAILLVVLLAPWMRRTAQLDASTRYRAQAGQALEEDNLALAELCYRKLAYLDKDPTNKYGLGIVAQRRGQPQRALRLMEQIAPLDRPGYAPAHFWIANYLAVLPLPEDRNERSRFLTVIERHLRFVLQTDADNDEAHVLLGNVYWRVGQWARAQDQWRQVQTERPEILYLMAQAAGVQGSAEMAKNYAEAAGSLLRQQIAREIDVVEAELQLAAVEAFLRRHEQAAELLNNGWERTKDPRYRESLIQLLVAWYELISTDDSERRVAVVQQALALDADDPAVLRCVAGLAATKAEGREEVQRLIEDILTDDSSPAAAAAHFVAGTFASNAGDLEKARLHLEQAHQAMPDQASVANNLAWVLAHSDPVDLDHALELADAAIAASTERPEFHGTRGRILFKLGKWKEATNELEYSLRAVKGDPQLHRLLAQTYEELGDAELADEHRRKAATLETGNE